MTAMKEQPSARQIYGTIGPACADVKTLEAMFRAGMTGIRLNLSHVTLAQAADQVDALHKAAQRCGKQAELLIDMQGPELRVGVLAEPMTLNEGEVLELGGKGIPLPDIAIPALLPGQEVLLDDGKLLLRVTEQTESGAVAEVLRGGVLRGRKSLALPGADLDPPTMTASDVENIRVAASCGVTGVMQPFVRSRRDLETVRRALDENGGANIRLFAKIENQMGLERLPEFLETADEIVIARGDLGNAMPLWELPAAQKRIEAQCRKAGKPFMVVTQMLASMEQNPVPTRAEVSDIFNAVADGAAAVMVTGETAVGKWPVEVIRYLSNTVQAAERFLREGYNRPRICLQADSGLFFYFLAAFASRACPSGDFKTSSTVSRTSALKESLFSRALNTAPSLLPLSPDWATTAAVAFRTALGSTTSSWGTAPLSQLSILVGSSVSPRR